MAGPAVLLVLSRRENQFPPFPRRHDKRINALDMPESFRVRVARSAVARGLHPHCFPANGRQLTRPPGIAVNHRRFYDLRDLIATPIPDAGELPGSVEISGEKVWLTFFRYRLLIHGSARLRRHSQYSGRGPGARGDSEGKRVQMRSAFRSDSRGEGLGTSMRRCLWAIISAFSVLVVAATAASAVPLEARGFKMAGDATHMRIVVQFATEPETRWVLLRGPYRLAIDLPETRFAFEPDEIKPRGLVRNIRYGALNAGASRLILATKGPFTVDRVDVLANEDGAGYRMVIEIAAASDRAFEAALADQAAITGSTVATPKGRPRRRDRRSRRQSCSPW